MAAGIRLPDEARERLAKLWLEGYSASAVSRMLYDEFGEYRTRNAVIGIVHRLGLRDGVARRTTRYRIGDDGVKQVEPRPPKPPRQKRLPRPEVVAVDPAAELTPPPVIADGVPLMQVRHDHCREVLGHGEDGLAVFCGAPMVRSSYCAWHGRINYQPAPSRKAAA